MFQNAAVDVAIGLIVMYLVLSLLCTVVNESIATWLGLRSRNLAAGLKELLDDPVVRNAFYDHGLIAGTSRAVAGGARVMALSPSAPTIARTSASSVETPVIAARPAALVSSTAPGDVLPGMEAHAVAAPAAAPEAETQAGDHPSYLSAETFALSLIGALTGTRLAQGQPTPGFADLRAAIEALPPSNIKSALQASLMSAQGDFNAFRQSVTTWFDDSMDRLGGAYKRHLKLISILVGCAMAVIMNADTFAACHALWSDSGLRTQTAQVATLAVQPPGAAAAKPSPGAGVSGAYNAYRGAVETLSPLPIGWSWPMPDWSGPSRPILWAWFVIVKLVGWFATGLALSLGAPFWFDLLSKFINLRGAGVKPVRQDAK